MSFVSVLVEGIAYCWKKGDLDWVKSFQTNVKKHPSKNLEADYINRSTEEIIDKLEEIDKTIEIAAPDWPLDQIDNIDLAILTVGVYELLFREDIPPKVAIDEAVELAKEFGGENSASFINGVLGTVFRASDRYKGEESEVTGKDRSKKDGDEQENKTETDKTSEKED